MDPRYASEADPLSAYWNAVVRGIAPPRGNLDPELASTVLRLHAADATPELSARRRAQIWTQLVASRPVPVGPPTVLSEPRASGNGRTACTDLLLPAGSLSRGRRWLGSNLATAALVLLVLGLVYLGFAARFASSRLPTMADLTLQADMNPNAVPMFRGNAAHTGVMPGPGPSGPPRLLWRFAMPGGPVMSSPAVVDGVVYAGNVGGAFYALEAATGEVLWQAPSLGRAPAPWAPAGTPAVSGDLVYVANQGVLHAFETRTGTERWRFAAGKWALAAPTIVDGVVYFGSDDHALYALDAATGAELWHFTTRDTIAAPPAVVGGVAYLHSGDGMLYAIDTTTGHERWHTVLGVPGSLTNNPLSPVASGPGAIRESGSVNMSAPAVADGLVYVGAANGMVYAMDAATGADRWSFRAGDEITGSPAVADGTVYIGSSDANLYALDAATGAERWRFDLSDSLQFSSPAVVDGTVYIGSNDRNVYAVDAASGHELWRSSLGGPSGSSPAVVGGVVFIGSDDGSLYAIGDAPRATPAP